MKEEMSDFLKFVKKYGEIKDVAEAFEEFPPEEEWHKGRIENVLREKSEDYNLYKVGDIVYVKKYYYLDGSVGENHFFVIVEQDNIAVPIESFGMLISSRLEKLKFKTNVELKKDELNNLDRDSIVKTDAIYKIPNDQILFKMGEVSQDKIEEYKKCYRKNKKNNNIKNGGIMSYDDFCKTPEYKEYALTEEEVEYYMNIYKERCEKEVKHLK